MSYATSVNIPGPYLLEGLFTIPEGIPKGLALICHPHPLYQGTMHNKVVTALARAAAECGYISLRFNFRGVGNSKGSYGEGVGELEDAKSALAFLQQQAAQYFPANHINDIPIVIMGFSFGGYIAAELAAQMQPTPQALITIAPALHYENLQVSHIPDCPWLLVHGEADEVIPFSHNKQWLDERSPSTKLVAFPDTGHFFHGKLIELQKIVSQFIQTN